MRAVGTLPMRTVGTLPMTVNKCENGTPYMWQRHVVVLSASGGL